MTAKGDFFPSRTNDHVPNMQFAADVHASGVCEMYLGVPDAEDPDGILDAQSIATAGSTTTFETSYTGTEAQMCKFGRNVIVVADGAATSTVTVTGKDYLGQVMVETLTLNGTSSVKGAKAFRSVTSVAWGATASRSIDVGWGERIGLPYKSLTLLAERRDGSAVNAGSATFNPGNGATQTATTSDPRGYYESGGLGIDPNGARSYHITATVDRSNLHGNTHFAG
jgi:hypothetical protein